MSQQRLWEFEAPDSTFDLNSRFVAIAPAGLYYGFDPVLGSSMSLGFNHLATGLNYVNEDLTLTDRLGVVVTKQGVEIRIGGVSSLPINPTSVSGRRDAIILEHSYALSTGGNPATISVIENIGSGLPSLTAGQVLLGILELPANCTALNQTGVVYTRSSKPNFASNDDLKVQLQAEITARQNADTALQTAINNEVAARQNADNALNTAVSQKIDQTEKGAVNGVVPLDASQMIDPIYIPIQFRESEIVDNIAERNAITPLFNGLRALVLDATGDPSVSSGAAGYIYRTATSTWIKEFESESLDLNLGNYYTKSEAKQKFRNVVALANNYDFNYAFPPDADSSEWGHIMYSIVIDTAGTFNSPPANFGTLWLLEAVRIDTDRIMQVATDMDYGTNPNKWYRMKSYTNSGNWTAWRRMATDVDISTLSAAISSEASARASADSVLATLANSKAVPGATGTWAQIPFLTASSDGSGSFTTLDNGTRYRKDQFGMVHLEGRFYAVYSGTGTICTVTLELPVGFRPYSKMVVPIDPLDSGGSTGVIQTVESDGKVKILFNIPNIGVASYFTGISFYGN